MAAESAPDASSVGATGTSLASMGFGAWSSIEKGKAGKADAYAKASMSDFQAERAARAAEFGRLQAEQVDGQLREQMDSTLAMIDAVRTASNIDPTSPTGIAIMENEERIADRERRNKTLSLRAQAAEDDATAAYSRNVAAYQRAVGNAALRSGQINAGVKIVKGIASMGMGL